MSIKTIESTMKIQATTGNKHWQSWQDQVLLQNLLNHAEFTVSHSLWFKH